MVQQQRSLMAFALLLPVALGLGGCPRSLRSDSEGTQSQTSQSGAPQIPTPPAAVSPPAPPRPLQPPRENRLSPATRSLVTQSKTLLARGDINGASSTLDRALRIEPSNPLLWIELGRVRLVDSEPAQAENCARKALVLASGDRAAQAQAGRLLADALRTQNRNPEAAEVESRPYMH